MVKYVRSLNITQMLTNGAEGYRAGGAYDLNAPITYPFNNWLNDGSKGRFLNFNSISWEFLFI